MSQHKPTVAEVEGWYPNSALDPEVKQRLVNAADRYIGNVFGGLVSREGELEMDETDARCLAAAHLWVLAEGGEVNSESQAAGSIARALNTGGFQTGLGETRFGRMLLTGLHDGGGSFGVEQTY